MGMMNEIGNDRIMLKIAGERFEFLYNREKQEVYNPLFPGIKIEKIRANCGHIIPHNIVLKMVKDKAEEFELAIAKFELNQAIEDFKDYSDSF